MALLLLLFRQFMLSTLTFVFAAFIAPTSLTLPISRQLGAEDTYQVLDRIDTNQETTLILALLVLITAYLYFRSFVEALATLLVVTVAPGVLSAPIIQDLYLPSSLQSANANERTIRASLVHDTNKTVNGLLSGAEHYTMLAIIIVLIVVPILVNTSGSDFLFEVIPNIATLVIALVATIALFPYIYNIYPVPHRTEYYVGILRSPWLPAEKLSLAQRTQLLRLRACRRLGLVYCLAGQDQDDCVYPYR